MPLLRENPAYQTENIRSFPLSLCEGLRLPTLQQYKGCGILSNVHIYLKNGILKNYIKGCEDEYTEIKYNKQCQSSIDRTICTSKVMYDEIRRNLINKQNEHKTHTTCGDKYCKCIPIQKIMISMLQNNSQKLIY